MSEIQSFNDANIIKYLVSIVGGLVVIINALIGYIMAGMKKSIDRLTEKFERDHDRLTALESEHASKNKKS